MPDNIPRSSIRRFTTLLAVAVSWGSPLLLAPAMVRADTWNAASGNWNTDSLWGDGSEPTSSDNVYVTGTGTVTINRSGEVCNSLYLGGTPYLPSSGAVEMTGGALTVANDEIIGHWHSGTFTQSAGTNTVGDGLCLGYTPGYSGTFNLSGGTVSSAVQHIGYQGTGIFNQTGGNNVVDGNLYLGYASQGRYALSDGTLTVGGAEHVGSSGVGQFTQSGGTHTISGSAGLVLAANSTSTGSYYLNNGTLALKALTAGSGTSSFSMGSGTLQADASFTTAVDMTLTGLGKVNTNGYNVIFSGDLSGSGLQKTGNGRLTLSGNNTHTLTQVNGGSLAITGSLDSNGYLSISNDASVSQSGASSSVALSTSLSIASGSYTLNAGTLTAAYEHIGTGSSGVATFTQSGGTNTITGSGLILASGNTATGVYNLNGGTLALHSLTAGSGAAKFNFGAGTLQANGNFSTPLDMTLTNNSTYATVNTNGHSVTLSGDLAGTGGLVKAGSGTLTLSGNNTYTGNTTVNAGDLAITGSLTGTSLFNIANGSVHQSGSASNVTPTTLNVGLGTGKTGAYALVAGALDASSEAIGKSGTGTFTQTGGSHNVAGSLRVGWNASGTGYFNLQGGALAASYIDVGYGSGTGTFTQTAGENTVSNNLVLGYDSAGDGTYLLHGGTLSANNEFIGRAGSGAFTQTGGVNTIATSLVIARDANSTGTYSLNGGTLALRSMSIGSGSGQFLFGGGSLQAANGFAATLPITLTGIGGDAKVDTNGFNVAFGGNLTGNGGLVKNGAGMLTLAGTNNYAGDTTVNAGTLLVTGVITGATTVNDAATLGGTGTVGAVMVNDGGILAPGASIGTLTVTGDMTLAPDAMLLFELESPSHSDLISMAGATLTIDGLDLDNFTFDYAALMAGMYTLIDAGAVLGNLGDNLTSVLAGLTATLSLSDDNTDVILTLSGSTGAVPEPASLFLWSAGLVGLALLRRRR